MSIPDLLVEQLANGNCVFFLGAGISVGTREEQAERKGLLSGASLTQILAEKSGYCHSEECPYYWAPQKGDQCGFAIKEDSPPSWPEQYCRASLLKVSQYFELCPGHGRAALTRILKDKFPDNVLPLRTHKALSQIALLGKMPFVITTNYDTLLEEALRTRGIECNPIIEDKDITLYSDKETQIVKLHGTLKDIDSYVITEKDYLEVSQRLQLPQSLIGNTIRYLLSTHTVLFIGFSLEDQDFRALYHDVVSTLGRYQQRAFAVQWKPTKGSRHFWKELNVQIINQDATRFLEELVGRLAITLAQREGSQAIPALEQLLGEIDPIIGKNVAGAMACIDSEAIVPILCQFLRGPVNGDEGNISIHVEFIHGLEKVPLQRAIPILEQIIHDGKMNPYARTTATDVLGEIGKQEASGILCDILLDPNIELEVRCSAADALWKISDEKAIRTLVRALQTQQIHEKEKDATLRSVIASALGNIGSDEACTALIKAVEDSRMYLEVRVNGAIALGRMKAEPAKVRAKSLLVDVIRQSDLDTRLRKAATLALGDIGDQSVVAELQSVMVDRRMEREVRTSIAAALGKIGGQKAATILGEVLQAEAQFIPLEIRRREKHAESLKKVLKEKATDIAQEVLPQEEAIRRLSSILQKHATEIADQLVKFPFLGQGSSSAIVLSALREEEKEAQLVIDRIGEGGRLDEEISKKAIEVFGQTVSMSPIELLRKTDVDPILAISDNLRDKARVVSLEIIDDGSIADNILAQIKLLDQESYLYFKEVREDLRAAIWELTGSLDGELAVEIVGAKFQEKADEIARETAQVDKVSREVAIEISKALGNFKGKLTKDAIEGNKIAFDALGEVLKDERLDNDIRSHATESLGKIDIDGEAVEVLAELLEEPAIDIGIGTSIVRALGATGKDKAAKILGKLLRDKEKDIHLRGSTVFPLARIGSEEAKQILSEVAQDDEEPLIQTIASQALEDLDQKLKPSFEVRRKAK